MANNTKDRLPWIVRFPPKPEPDSEHEHWLKCGENVQSERDLVNTASSQPENPEVIRCVRGFVAWKFSGSVPEAHLPNERELSRRPVFS